MSLSLLLRQFFDEYSEAVMIADEKGGIMYTNDAFTRLTGFTFQDLRHSIESDVFKIKINPDVAKNSTYWESGIQRKDGDHIWVRISVSPILLNDGVTGKVYTLMNNPALDQMKGMLRESETRFAILADAIPVMIWMTDIDNLAYYFNKSWLDFTGRKVEEQIGTGWFKNVHTDDWKVFNDLNTHLKAHESYQCEYRLKRYDGVYRHILEIGTPRILPDGAFAGYMGSCLDITDMKEVQNELANHTKELKRSNEELEQFAYVASHDLQEPLRMIGSYVQLIQKRMEANNTANLDEYMKYVVDGVSRMQALISDLLQFSRVNRKGNPFAMVDLNEIMQIVVAHLKNRIEEAGAIVTYPKMPVVNGDSFQLIRLLQNLIDNAIKFKAPNRQPEIKINVEDKENEWLFSISDNGIGIDNKFYNRIFVIFQRLHGREEYEGTGIGLAICKKIVERHGGNIWVESEAGKGSTFYFGIRK